MLRPEFHTFLDHEQKTIALVKDVADVMETVAFGQLHTPALYSCFLRALISAKTEPSDGSQPLQLITTTADSLSEQGVTISPNGLSSSSLAGGLGGGTGMGGETGHLDPLAEFQFDGEMGPVADISTFPPTMAAAQSDEHLGMLSIDTILSTSFWDNVLVPGKSAPDSTHHHRSNSL